jgi:hypothetical protein
MPGLTSVHIFDDIHEHCNHIQAQTCKLFDPRQYASPAAFVQTFLNDAVGVRLPSYQDWVDGYTSNPVMSKIIQFIQNPGLTTNKLLEEFRLNANYCLSLTPIPHLHREWHFDISGGYCWVQILHSAAARPVEVSHHNIFVFSC